MERIKHSIANGVAIFSVSGEDSIFYDPDPETVLMLAILKGAAYDLEREGDKKRNAIIFFMDDSEDYFFSFANICSYLRLNPVRIRSYLKVDELIGEITEMLNLEQVGYSEDDVSEDGEDEELHDP